MIVDCAHALWFPAARSVEIRSETLPPVGPEEARVEAVASGISHGTEMLVYRGQVPDDLPLDLPTLRGSFTFPIKYGYASVGRVAEVGPAVQRLAPGDLVFALHPHQTRYVVPAALAARLPADLPPEHGVFLANMETAVNVLLDARPRLGDRVAVYGLGVIGLLVTQLLRRAGVERIVAVDPIAARRTLALDIGADVALAPEEATPAAIRDLTGGIGADLAVEASGNPAALAAAVEAVGQEGTVVVPAWYGTKPVSLPLGGSFHRGRVRIVSSQVGSLDPALAPRWDRARRQALARELLGRLQLAPLITHRIPFEQAAEAYALVYRHPEEVVQVILTYGEPHV
jgi:2-desacetyl-2-hydroxyethyl bacteriochlorophyllide A dehydrogenase